MATGNGHSSTARALPRKPAGRVHLRHCYCSHAEAEHASGACDECECEAFRARPCVCGHAAAAHTGQCQHCDCRNFREDGSPSFLLERGIRAGEWQFITDPQLLWLMRPGQDDPTYRVWACLMRHCQRGKTSHDRRRLAVKMNVSGQWVPLLPSDIADELNALDTIPRMNRHIVSRELKELQRLGAIRRDGNRRQNVRLFVYLRPLSKKEVRPEPEPVPPTPNPDLVTWPDNQNPQLSAKSTACRHTSFSHIRSALVKSFRARLREDVAAAGGLVVSPDNQKQVDEILEEALLVVQAAYKKALLVICPAALNKEDSITSSKASSSGASASPVVESAVEEPVSQSPDRPTTTEPPPPDPPEPEPDPVLTALNHYGPGDEAAADAIRNGCQEKCPDATDEEIAHCVHAAGEQARGPGVKNPVGLLIRKTPKLAAHTIRQYRADLARAREAHTRQAAEAHRLAEQTLTDPDASRPELEWARDVLKRPKTRTAGGGSP